MKLRRISPTDLAEISPLAPSFKRKALEKKKSGGGTWSYDPIRSQEANCFQTQNPLGLKVPFVTQSQIEQEIRRACKKGEEQIASNVEVGHLLYDWVQTNGVVARDYKFPLLGIGHVDAVRFWSNMIFEFNEERYVPFFDYRRGHGLTEKGRRFVFSVMHHQIRVLNPDFADYRLAIFRFPSLKDGPRSIRIYTDRSVALFGFEEVAEMVSETYRMWQEVLEGRREGGSLGGTGTGGR